MAFSLKKLIHKIDLFGRNQSFEEDENQKFTTNLGVIMTIILIIISLVIGFLFGKEIYQRKNPSVVQSVDKKPYSRISLKDFPIYLVIGNSESDNFQIENYLDIYVASLSWENEGIIYSQAGTIKKELPEFSENLLPEYLDFISTSYSISTSDTLTRYYIHPYLDYFQDSYLTSNMTMMNIAIRKCQGDHCAKDIDEVILSKSLYVGLMFLDSYLDPTDYQNSIKYFSSSISCQIHPSFLKRYYISFSFNKFVSDVGWILEHYEEHEHIVLQNSRVDMFPSYEGHLLWLTLESPINRQVIYRSYMKLQDLLAKIGGFFNAIYLTLYFLSTSYIKYKYKMNIIQKIIQNNQDIFANNICNTLKNRSNLLSTNNLVERKDTFDTRKFEHQEKKDFFKTENTLYSNNNIYKLSTKRINFKMKNNSIENKELNEINLNKIVENKESCKSIKSSMNLHNDGFLQEKDSEKCIDINFYSDESNIEKYSKYDIILQLMQRLNSSSYFKYIYKNKLCSEENKIMSFADKILSFNNFCKLRFDSIIDLK